MAAIACLALGSASIARPAEGVRFGHLTIEDGLPNNRVLAILKDSEGFLWFGTQNGLTRYDGTGFKFYRHEDNNPASLASSVAGVLYEDSKKRLWVGSFWGNKGVALYDRAHDSFRSFFPTSDPDAQDGNHVRSIIEGRDGMIWLGTDNGLARVDPDKGTVQRFPIDPKAEANDPQTLVAGLFQDSRGRMWVGTGEGLLRFDAEQGSYTRWEGRANDPNGLDHADVWSFYEDESHRLWIATHGSGLHVMDPETGSDHAYLPDPHDPTSLGNARLLCLLADGKGTLYLGTEGGGLNVFDMGKKTFRRYVPEIGDDTSLSSGSIWSLFLDDQGTLWIGTFNGGVNILSPYLQRFRNVTARRGGLNDSHVSSILEDREGIVWIGTDGSGLDRWDPKTGTYRYFRSDPSDPTTVGSDAVWALLEDSRGNLWVGGWAGGLGLLDRSTGRVKRFLHDPANPYSIVNDNVWRIVELKTGEMLVATQQGADFFDRDTGHFTRVQDRYPGVTANVIYSATEDQKGNLWFVGSSFVGKVDRRSHRVTRYPDIERLGSGWTQAVLVDSHGNVWTGSEGGLSCLVAGSERWVRYSAAADGLSDDTIVGLIEDGGGNLWVSTGSGLNEIVDAVSAPDHPQVYRFDVRDGLQGQEFARNACFRGGSGQVYFGGSRGLNVFRPDSVRLNRVPPKVALTDLRILNESQRPGAPGSPLKVAIGETKDLVLSDKDTVVSFDFAALNYVLPAKNRYKYMLDPFDKGWVDAGTQHTATYTNLPRGKHFTFRVKAANNDGVWNEEGVALGVYVTPLWYERWYTWIFFGLLVVVGVVTLYRVRVRALKAREQDLALRVAEKTADLQKEIDEHQRTEKRLAEENEERQRAEEEARQAAVRLQEGNARLVEQQTALERENQERRRAEEVAGRERDLLGALMDNIPDLIYFKDLQSRFVRANAALAATVGAPTAEAMVGRTDRDFFSPDFAAETEEEERRLMRSGQAVVSKLQVDARDGRWYLATKVPIREPDGKISGLVGISKDITERKLAEDRLEEDLKTYLEVVSSVAQGDLTQRGQEGEETLGRIARSVNQMLEGFGTILGEVRDAAFAVSSSSSEILAAATQIAKGAQHGRDQVESTQVAVEEMAASMTQVAKNAASSSEKAHRVLDHVRRGNEATQVTNAGMARIDAAATETAEKMRLLEKRSGEIFEIIGLIEDLASQSALLRRSLQGSHDTRVRNRGGHGGRGPGSPERHGARGQGGQGRSLALDPGDREPHGDLVPGARVVRHLGGDLVGRRTAGVGDRHGGRVDADDRQRDPRVSGRRDEHDHGRAGPRAAGRAAHAGDLALPDRT
jgi:PAS domain S-box-containing protein